MGPDQARPGRVGSGQDMRPGHWYQDKAIGIDREARPKHLRPLALLREPGTVGPSASWCLDHRSRRTWYGILVPPEPGSHSRTGSPHGIQVRTGPGTWTRSWSIPYGVVVHTVRGRRASLIGWEVRSGQVRWGQVGSCFITYARVYMEMVGYGTPFGTISAG